METAQNVPQRKNESALRSPFVSQLTRGNSLSVPEIQRALRVKRFTEPLTVRPLISNLILQLDNLVRVEPEQRFGLTKSIRASVTQLETAIARQGD